MSVSRLRISGLILTTLSLQSPANFMREDWEPIQENIKPTGKARVEYK